MLLLMIFYHIYCSIVHNKNILYYLLTYYLVEYISDKFVHNYSVAFSMAPHLK